MIPASNEEIDTIPKPVGLGAAGRLRARSLQRVFIEYSMNIQCAFSVRSTPIAVPLGRSRRIQHG